MVVDGFVVGINHRIRQASWEQRLSTSPGLVSWMDHMAGPAQPILARSGPAKNPDADATIVKKKPSAAGRNEEDSYYYAPASQLIHPTNQLMVVITMA